MGQKANPKSLRIQLTKDWDSRWIAKNNLAYTLLCDEIIRNTIKEKLGNTGIDRVVIERGNQETKIIIHTSRPGVIIGRSGKGISDLKTLIEKNILSSTAFRLVNSRLDIKAVNEIKKNLALKIKINIAEIREPEASARINAADIAMQLEKRMPYRKIIKRLMGKMANSRKIKGIKICVSGRLGGVDIARTEKFSQGSIPLSSLKAQVDYAYVPALTTHGVIGVKVWIYQNNK